MISASSIDVREVEGLQQHTNSKKHHYAVVKIDGKEVFKSVKVPCLPTPQWKADEKIQFTPTSDIAFVIYRNSRFLGRLRRVQVAKCIARGIDFLNTEDVEQELADKSGKVSLAVKFDLVVESTEDFLKALKEEVSQVGVKGADAAQGATTAVTSIGAMLKAMVPVIDNFAGSHPILNGAWIVLSSAYKHLTYPAHKIAQNQAAQDGVVQDLVDSLSEMAGAASSWEEPREISATGVNVIDEIGNASLEVAMLVHDYVCPSIQGKAKFLCIAHLCAHTFRHAHPNRQEPGALKEPHQEA
ncbi:hypothetical protein FIBSPDRAFT_935417 [Athelia psychrophila]|uniref:C2 domain-containing protein n=1 Tax=Athelia psychrophila TaxID=1759441 RepID=A0A166DT06_9AGAM|nr:hypothetical protein FIBSPDRAFT_935417 [Fibularhizoctonia sp. CBS 109695]